MRLRSPSLQAVLEAARASLSRFPDVLTTSFAAGLICWLAVDWTIADSTQLFRLATTLIPGISLSFALALRAQATGRGRLAGTGIVAGLLLLHYLSFCWESPQVYLFRCFQFGLAAHLLVAFIAYWPHGNESGFWAFNEEIFLRLVTAVFFSAVLSLGLIIALLAVQHLLGCSVGREAFPRTVIFTAFGFNTWFFLSGIPDRLPQSSSAKHYPHSLKTLTQYLLIPLVTLYVLILYAYLAKIGLTREWPKGTVGYLVSAFSLLGIFTLLLLHPLRQAPENRWISRYAAAFYPALLPLIALLLLGTWRRIDDYGITERRYLLSAYAAWLAIISLYFTFGRRKDIRIVPISLCLATLLTSIGPWSAYRVSYRSQLRRLETLLTDNGLLTDGHVRKATHEISWKDRRAISTILDYLRDMHRSEGIRDWFTAQEPESARLHSRNEAITRQRMAELGIEYVGRWQESGEKHF